MKLLKRMRTMKKLNWAEITSYSGQELKKHYKLTDRQVEQNMRHHLDGANAKERREVYQQLWQTKR